MAEVRKIRRALISVYDKTGVVDFARALHDEFGIEIISTGGTAKTLRDAGIPVTLVEDITGFPEMMDGRVKTLHPKIHAAILADRDNPEHMRQLAAQGIEPIDMVVVNLYPFEQTIARPDCTFEEAIEMIDIGGPCLLRAAAKNHGHIWVISQARLCDEFLAIQRERDPAIRLSFAEEAKVRRTFAQIAFGQTAHYDDAILAWLLRTLAGETETLFGTTVSLPSVVAGLRQRIAQMRYGENPHQSGALYGGARRVWGPTDPERQEVETSFNNYADASAALELCAELSRAASSAKMHFAQPSVPPDAGLTGARPRQDDARHGPVRDEVAYRRKLPHWQVAGAAYFVTFSSAIGDFSEPERDAVLTTVRFWDGKKFELHAAVVMPDHVHMLLTPRPVNPTEPGRHNLTEILQSIKANSARSINRMRRRSGQVWLRESYDRWLRTPEELVEKWEYIANNPVKEGLAPTPHAYRWWYARESLGAFEEERSNAADAASSPSEGEHTSLRADTQMCEESLRTTQPRGEENLRPTARAASVCFIKHTNACGAAVDVDPVEGYRRAYLGDPNAAMGGVLAVNSVVDRPFAEAVMETYARWGKPLKEAGAAQAPGGFFVEVWVAPSFEDEAVNVIRTKKEWGKRVRLLTVGDMNAAPDPAEMDFKRIAGGMLMQSRDLVGLDEEQWQVVTRRQPTESEMNDLRLAWLVAKHTKSNAISLCRDGMLIGNGAGQMSRVMSCRIATWLAQANGHADALRGAAAASDGFFPFRDGPDLLIDAGITALIQPGGSKRDAEVIAACDERNVAMILTGTRHFKH